ncbi:glycoside hydrolase family 3 C-terminal domain-containing protein [Streptomyces sp. NPDC008137]|uniref:glycoside hydrolase family 3 C-terminal domain-containing protein n=1 Tax=Streptomyces sp. NPDC008137 TaxID=3364813 RepID=UPI0036E7D4AD
MPRISGRGLGQSAHRGPRRRPPQPRTPRHRCGTTPACARGGPGAALAALVGNTAGLTGEGRSTATPELTGRQIALLDALGKLDGPFVVLVRGKPSILPARALGADAIVQAFTPRMQAGGAVAEPLLGRTEPSGWLPVPYQPRPGQHGDSAPV